jgi:hypothetical protein
MQIREPQLLLQLCNCMAAPFAAATVHDHRFVFTWDDAVRDRRVEEKTLFANIEDAIDRATPGLRQHASKATKNSGRFWQRQILRI